MTTDDKIFPPNTSAYYAIESVDGYDPLSSGRYEEFIAALNRNKPETTGPFGFNRIIVPHNIDSKVAPLLNVRFVLSLTDLDRPFLKKVFQEGETRIYEYLNGLPRVYIADAVKTLTDSRQILQVLFDTDYRRSSPAVLEEEAGVESKPLQEGEYVHLVSYGPAEIRVQVRAALPRMIVILTQYDPGWRAMVDGKSTRLYRANYAFQGVPVPAGDHDVLISYH